MDEGRTEGVMTEMTKQKVRYYRITFRKANPADIGQKPNGT